MEKYEQELEQLRSVAGADPEVYPLNWIKWESSYKNPKKGIRAPPWRESEGDIGYVLAATHDKGVVAILIKNDETCVPIKGYGVSKEANEELDYTPIGSAAPDLRTLLSSYSETFKSKIDAVLEAPPEIRERVVEPAINNELVSLPMPVLVLNQPETEGEGNGEATEEQEDDEPILPFPKQSTSSDDFPMILGKMKNFTANTADPTNTDLQDICNNPALREAPGQRAVLQAGAISAMRDVLRIKQIREGGDTRRAAQVEAAIKIFAAISLSPQVRRHMANDDTVNIFIDILKRDESKVLNDLFTTIANCCHNTNFRNLLLKNGAVEHFIVPVKNPEYTSQICYVLWTLNRTPEASRAMANAHLSNVLEKFTQSNKAIAALSDDIMLNITRVMYSMAMYGKASEKLINDKQVIFFCTGLGRENPDLAEWAARAFTIFTMNEEQQKQFCQNGPEQCQGPMKLTRLIDGKAPENVLLSALETISVIGNNQMIRDELVRAGVLTKLGTLWKSENPAICKGALKVIGILTQNQQCLNWTERQQMITPLLEYLNSTDYEFVIYAAKAIGSCCNHDNNLKTLIAKEGVRKLWSLMKSKSSGVQAAATRALVPFLKSPTSPPYVRTFVDGLDLLVGLLKSSDPEVQASACMAISEVAKDNENLGVMTDLGVVELLSRLLTTKLDSVRKPLADAIGYAANYGDNRRRFGEEGAVDPLVSYLRPPSNNLEVHAATAKALKALSEDHENSKKLSQAGVVDYLLKMVESQDTELQMAAAVAIRNIRTNRA